MQTNLHVSGPHTDGSVVREVTDSEVFINAVFTKFSVENLQSDTEDSLQPDWDRALIIINKYHLQFNYHQRLNYCDMDIIRRQATDEVLVLFQPTVQSGWNLICPLVTVGIKNVHLTQWTFLTESVGINIQDLCGFIIVIEAFTVWDYQIGFHLKRDVKHYLDDARVKDRIRYLWEAEKVRLSAERDNATMDSIALSQLIGEVTHVDSQMDTEEPGTSRNQQQVIMSGVYEKPGTSRKQRAISTRQQEEPESASINMLEQEFSIKRLLISPQNERKLNKIKEWKEDYIPTQTDSSGSFHEEINSLPSSNLNPNQQQSSQDCGSNGQTEAQNNSADLERMDIVSSGMSTGQPSLHLSCSDCSDTQDSEPIGKSQERAATEKSKTVTPNSIEIVTSKLNEESQNKTGPVLGDLIMDSQEFSGTSTQKDLGRKPESVHYLDDISHITKCQTINKTQTNNKEDKTANNKNTELIGVVGNDINKGLNPHGTAMMKSQGFSPDLMQTQGISTDIMESQGFSPHLMQTQGFSPHISKETSRNEFHSIIDNHEGESQAFIPDLDFNEGANESGSTMSPNESVIKSSGESNTSVVRHFDLSPILASGSGDYSNHSTHVAVSEQREEDRMAQLCDSRSGADSPRLARLSLSAKKDLERRVMAEEKMSRQISTETSSVEREIKSRKRVLDDSQNVSCNESTSKKKSRIDEKSNGNTASKKTKTTAAPNDADSKQTNSEDERRGNVVSSMMNPVLRLFRIRPPSENQEISERSTENEESQMITSDVGMDEKQQNVSDERNEKFQKRRRNEENKLVSDGRKERNQNGRKNEENQVVSKRSREGNQKGTRNEENSSAQRRKYLDSNDEALLTYLSGNSGVVNSDLEQVNSSEESVQILGAKAQPTNLQKKQKRRESPSERKHDRTETRIDNARSPGKATIKTKSSGKSDCVIDTLHSDHQVIDLSSEDTQDSESLLRGRGHGASAEDVDDVIVISSIDSQKSAEKSVIACSLVEVENSNDLKEGIDLNILNKSCQETNIRALEDLLSTTARTDIGKGLLALKFSTKIMDSIKKCYSS